MSGFIKIKDLGAVSTSGDKVLKAKDYSYYVKSQSLLNDSRQEASRSQEEASELYLKSIEKGLNQGAEEAKARLAKQILNSASSIGGQLRSIETELSEVVISAVRRIISDFDDEILVLESVRNGLTLVSKSQRVLIRANPSVIGALRESLNTVSHDIHFLEIVPDSKLSTRECILESDIGIVNASVDAQIEAIEKAIRGKFLTKPDMK